MSMRPDHRLVRHVLALVLVALGAEALWPMLTEWTSGGVRVATASVLLLAGAGVWRASALSLRVATAALWIQLVATTVAAALGLTLALTGGAGSAGALAAAWTALAPVVLYGAACAAGLLWIRRFRVSGRPAGP